MKFYLVKTEQKGIMGDVVYKQLTYWWLINTVSSSNTPSPDSINKCGDFKSYWVKTDFLT